jgi:hypothetical protein
MLTIGRYGSDEGEENWACLATLIETAKFNAPALSGISSPPACFSEPMPRCAAPSHQSEPPQKDMAFQKGAGGAGQLRGKGGNERGRVAQGNMPTPGRGG